MKQDFNINSILQLPFIHQSHVLILKLSLHRAVVTKRQKERTTVSVPLGGADRKAGGNGCFNSTHGDYKLQKTRQ